MNADPASAEALRQEIFGLVERYYHSAHAPGGFDPGRTRIPYSGRVFDARELRDLISAALDFWLTAGPRTRRFAQQMAAFLGAGDFLMVNSGSSANLLAIAALCDHSFPDRLRPGDEVITCAMAFPSTVAPICQNGLLPVFVDCDPESLNPDPASIERAISARTRAVFLAHNLGNLFEVDAILQIARKHNLFLVEDCCDALGGRWRETPAGRFGCMASLSFYPAHQMTTGEGGGVVINDLRLAPVLRSLSEYGRDCWCLPGVSNTCGKRFAWKFDGLPFGYDHKYVFSRLGYNLKPTDLQAAIGLVQLEKLPQFVAARQENFARLYQWLLPHQSELILPRSAAGAVPCWYAFPITLRRPGLRAELISWLESKCIETRPPFAANLTRHPGFREIPHRVADSLKGCDLVLENTLFVGIYPGLSPEMIDFVGAQIDRFLRGDVL